MSDPKAATLDPAAEGPGDGRASSAARSKGAPSRAIDRTWRLRDLDRGDRRAAVALAVLLALPYAAAAIRARNGGWVPSGDAGMIGLFARDVLHGHPPLLNTPTTADVFGDGPPAHHPGPIQFYALALPMYLLGSTTGMLAWTVVANLASPLVAAWVVFRRCGPGVGLWAAVVLGAVAWSQGPALIVDPINSDAGAIALVGLAALAWAVACGDRRLLPLLAVWSAYYGQMYLGNLPIALAMVAWALAVVAVRMARARSSRDRAGRPSEGDAAVAATPIPTDPSVPRAIVSEGRWWPWLLGASLASLVLWAPVIVEAVVGDPSNVRLLWDYSSQDDRRTLGWSTGIRLAGHALDPRVLALRTGVDADDLLRRLAPVDTILAIVVVVGLTAVAVAWRRRSSAISLLASTVLVLTAVGIAVGAQVPIAGVTRLGFFRWTFAASVLAVLTFGAAAIDAARAARPVHRARWARPVGVAAAALLALSAALVAQPAHGREDVVWGMERRVSDAVLPAVEGKANVHVVPFGPLAARSLAMPLALDLESHGHRVTVPEYEVRNYGSHRSARSREPDVVVVLTGSLGPTKPGPGRSVLQTTTDPRSLDAYRLLVGQARGGPVVVSPQGDAMATAAGLDPEAFRLWVDGMRKDPARRLRDTTALRLFADGYLASPRMDPDAMATLLERDPPSLWGQDAVTVTVLTPRQFEAAYGRIR